LCANPPTHGFRHAIPSHRVKIQPLEKLLTATETRGGASKAPPNHGKLPDPKVDCGISNPRLKGAAAASQRHRRRGEV